MTVPLLAPERPDHAIFVSRVLDDPTIAPQLDAAYGAQLREGALEKAAPYARVAIERAMPGISQTFDDLSRQYERHEASVQGEDPMDMTMPGASMMALQEAQLGKPGDAKEESAPVFSRRESKLIIDAAKQVAINPIRDGEDLVALDFLAENSSEAPGKVSRFILETTKRHRHTRSLLTSLLLRLV